MIDPNELIFALKKNRRQYSEITEDLPIESVFGSTGRSNSQSTSGLNGHFVSLLLLIDVFIRMPSTNQDKQAFVKYCKKKGEDKSEIDDFNRNYPQKRAIWFYTCESFLHRVLNKALRQRNFEVLLLYRFIIADIYGQLKDKQCRRPIVVYRGQCMSTKEFKQLQQSSGQLISINSFFSTSESLKEAKKFLMRTSIGNKNYCRVLFTIKADPHVTSNTLFANIAEYAETPKECEILFMIGSIFRVGKIERKEEQEPYYEIQMTLCGDEENNLEGLVEHMKKDYGGGDENSTLLTLADAMRDMGQYDLAQQIYNQWNSELPLDDPLRSSLYKSLGVLYMKQGNYEKAHYWFNEARTLCMQRKRVDYVAIGDLYNWIGETYRLQGDSQLALARYKDSVESYKKGHAETHESLAHVYNNMAIIYGTQKEYATAMKYHEKVLEIRRRKLPANHPDIAASLNNIGIIHFFRNEYDQALKLYQQSLEIRQKSLSPQHSDIGNSHQNIGQVYQMKSDWEKAMECYKKAKDIYKNSFQSYHPYVVQLKKDMASVSSKMG